MKTNNISKLDGIMGAYSMFRCEKHLDNIIIVSCSNGVEVARLSKLMSIDTINSILKTYSIKATYDPLRDVTLEEVILLADENSVSLVRSNGNWIIIERNRNMVDLNVWLRKLKYIYKGRI